MKKKILSLLQLTLGVAIVLFLVLSINNKYKAIELTTEKVSADKDALYALDQAGSNQYIVVNSVTNASLLRILATPGSQETMPDGGRLVRRLGEGDAEIRWKTAASKPYGLSVLGQSFKRTGHNWHYLLGAFLTSFLCLMSCTKRWSYLMEAQGIRLPFRRAAALYFIGHFFNVFMPGAVGGDVIKAYYVSKEVDTKRTEVVSTVFIDRIVGLLALILLCVIVMTMRFNFYMQHAETKAAVMFVAMLAGGSFMGLLFVFQRKRFEKWSFFRRLEERTALGRIIGKMYTACHTCFTSGFVVVKTMAFSLMNHVMLVLSAYMISRAMELPLTILDCFTIFPLINAIAAIPATPGGLGLREAAATILLSVMNISEVHAVPLSLLVYASLMSWSLVGWIIYIVYSQKRGTARQAIQADEPTE